MGILQIYISLEGAAQEKVEADYQEQSVNLKIHDVNGKNYQFAVPRLAKKIVPSACKFLVKPKRVILTLKKANLGSWFELTKKEEKVMDRGFASSVPSRQLLGVCSSIVCRLLQSIGAEDSAW